MTDSSTNVQEAYDEWAQIYNTDENPTRDLNAKAIRQASLPLSDKRILEIGCGTGLNTQYLTQHASEVVGVDFSGEMLTRARRRMDVDNAQFIRGDITERWQFQGESFDMVVANLVLEHVRNLAFIFKEAYRVLCPGGIFYLAELHPYKQLQQSQAKYINKETGKEILVDAFTHQLSEYINGGLAVGFMLQKIKENKNPKDNIPRLLTLLFKKNG